MALAQLKHHCVSGCIASQMSQRSTSVIMLALQIWTFRTASVVNKFHPLQPITSQKQRLGTRTTVEETAVVTASSSDLGLSGLGNGP